MTSQLGRITIYSIAGCPHCLAAKKRLKTDNFQFIDVRVDRFPPEVRQWLQEKTGKTSVPQIFFNARYVGGNKELQESLDNQEVRKELLDILNTDPVNDDLPLLPNPGDAIESDDMEEVVVEKDKYFHIIEKVSNNCSIAGDHYESESCLMKMFSSPVKHSISGKDLMKVITDEGETDAEKVALHLLESRFLRKVSGPEDKSWSPDDLYILTGLEARSYSGTKCLNTFKMSSAPLSSPDLMAQQIRNILLKLFSTFLSEDGSAVDYHGISKSKLFEQFKLLSVELQRVDLNVMSETEKLAFFINIYNALVIHAHVDKGVPTTTYTRYKFFSSMSYNIGGYVLSLNDIENGILRANRASMATLYMKPFSKTDPRLKIMLSEVEPRIHFALNCGAKSCPPIKTFSGKEVLEQLDVATGAFLENDDALYINDDKTEVRLTQLFQWYQVDFGESMSQVLSWIHQHVTLPDKKSSLAEVLDRNQYKVSYTPYDWGHNAKE